MKLRTKLRYYYQRNEVVINIGICIITMFAMLLGIYICAYYGAEIDTFFTAIQPSTNN